MKSENPTLKKLFEGEKVYRVPLYQRLYVWNRADQWQPLWEDITSIAKALEGQGKVTPHFFGAIVLKMDGFTGEDSGVFRVIDGQQRLTTMQIVIAAVADELSSGGDDVRSVARLRELIENPKHAWPERRHKMRHGGNNYARFTDVVSAEGDEDAVRRLDGAMATCYLFFREAARNWLRSAIGDAERLTETLRTKLQIVAIYLDPEEPEHLVFETLNARGSPLTEWDKIRNYLLYRFHEQQDEFFTQYLEEFDAPWWRAWSGRGQDSRPRTDRFVDYWLESKIGKPVAVSRVFREFRERATPLPHDTLGLWIQSMADDAHYYQKWEKGEQGRAGMEATFHERRRQMNIGALWPFLFGLRRANLDDRQFRFVLATLESWFVRRWIYGHQARNYADRALDLLRLVSGSRASDTADVASRIIARLAEIDERGGRWPIDREVAEVVETSPELGRDLRRFLLEAVEEYITPKNVDSSGMRTAELQVEHLMPVAWRVPSWPIMEDSPEERAERDGWIQTLGNLTLVNGKLNASMSNSGWDQKREAIFRNSTLFLNKHIWERYPNWDERAIQTRGKWMAEQVCEIWPHAEVLRQRLGEP